MSANSERIRKPGEAFDLTDEEILAAPPRMLSYEQRRRRRQLKKNAAAQRTRSRREAAARGEPMPRRRAKDGKITPEATKIKFCQAETKKGLNCEGYAVDGAKHCVNHLTDKEREDLGIIRNTTEGVKHTASPPALAKEIVEVATVHALAPYFDSIGVEFLGFNEEGKPVVRYKGENSGLMLHGESRDGDIVMTNYPDLGGRVQIMEKLFDRVYGKPKQTQILEGGVKPIQVQPVRTVERAHDIVEIMRRTGMGAPSAPEPPVPHELEAPAETLPPGDQHVAGEVLPLRPNPKDDPS